MVLNVKYRFSIYRYLRLDVWGIFLSTVDMFKSRLSNFFCSLWFRRDERFYQRFRRYIYRIDVVNPTPFRKRRKRTFVKIRLLKYFYLNIKYSQFSSILKRSVKRDGFFEAWFLLYLEGRLAPIFLRANFARSMFEALSFVKEKQALFNNRRIKNPHFFLRPGKFLRLDQKCHKRIKERIFSRALKGTFLAPPSRFYYTDYRLFYLIMYKMPQKRDFTFPIRLDIFRANKRI